jgi:hypothetical protein
VELQEEKLSNLEPKSITSSTKQVVQRATKTMKKHQA